MWLGKDFNLGYFYMSTGETRQARRARVKITSPTSSVRALTRYKIECSAFHEAGDSPPSDIIDDIRLR